MILFTIIVVLLVSSLFRPRYYGFFGPMFMHRPHYHRFMRFGRPMHMGPRFGPPMGRGPMGHGPRMF